MHNTIHSRSKVDLGFNTVLSENVGGTESDGEPRCLREFERILALVPSPSSATRARCRGATNSKKRGEKWVGGDELLVYTLLELCIL